MSFEIDQMVRRNIRGLIPYSSARSDFSGAASIFLDANENPFGSPGGKPFNRYPDPYQSELRTKIAELNGISSGQVFVGNGSDEAIDLLFRIFCEPGRDRVVICPPTYGMYEVSAAINDIGVVRVPLTARFQPDVPEILAASLPETKLVFLCSPNNPTGNLIEREHILEICEMFDGIVVVDEAYIHFAKGASMVADLGRSSNLVVLQTFSKAWGLAGLRVGVAFASAELIGWFDRVKPPYNVSTVAQQTVLAALNEPEWMADVVRSVRCERDRLGSALKQLPNVETVFPSDANFILVKVADAGSVYRHLVTRGIVVRDRSRVELCAGCLRITIGTPEENDALLRAMEDRSPRAAVGRVL